MKIERPSVKFVDMPVAPLQGIDDTARLTGASRCFVRNGCRDGSIPCIKFGNKYMVNLPLFLEMLDAQSRGNVNQEVNA